MASDQLRYLVCIVIVLQLFSTCKADICESGYSNEDKFRSSTPRARFEAGVFTKYTQADNLDSCVSGCCDRRDCNVVFYYDETCYLIHCNTTGDACEPELRTEKKYRNTYMVIVRNWVIDNPFASSNDGDSENTEEEEEQQEADEGSRSCEYGLDIECPRHEMCAVVNSRSRSGVCVCKDRYVRNRSSGLCESESKSKVKTTTIVPTHSARSKTSKTTTTAAAATENDGEEIEYEPSSHAATSAATSERLPPSPSFAPKTVTSSTSESFTTSASSSSSSSVGSTVFSEHHTGPTSKLPAIAVVTANGGADQRQVFPAGEIVLDGSNSTGPGTLQYDWSQVSGPTFITVQDGDRARAKVHDLHLGEYKFKLKVTALESGSSSEDFVTVVIVDSVNHPPVANAGGDVVITLPTTFSLLDGSRSHDDRAIVQYEWSRDDSSPAAGVVLNGSDHNALLLLTGLVHGNYTFRLKVTDSDGLTSVDTARIFVLRNPLRANIVRLVLAVDVKGFSEGSKKSVESSLSVLLLHNTRVHIVDISSTDSGDLCLQLVAYSQSDNPSKPLPGQQVAAVFREKLLGATNLLEFPVVSVNTLECTNNCSGYGVCDAWTHNCVCQSFYMQNVFRVHFGDGQSNCDISPALLSIITSSVAAVVMVTVALVLCTCRRCRSPNGRKVKDRHEYNLLSTADRSDWRDKGGKYRSSNTASLRTDSDLSSEEETLFVNTGPNSASRNGNGIKAGLKT